jgi:hypothetical protein
MRRVTTLLCAFGLAAYAAPLCAGAQFAAYDGPDSVKTGTGGAKIVKDGIEFWTIGTPPRRFQVLGFITDSRHDKLLSGRAIGSSGIAKRVREAGGDAVVVVDQDKRADGVIGSINLSGGPSWGRAVHEITTQFIVVKYLP